MCIIVIERELRLNAVNILKSDTDYERLQLLIQRSNLKDMLIDILRVRAA